MKPSSNLDILASTSLTTAKIQGKTNIEAAGMDSFKAFYEQMSNTTPVSLSTVASPSIYVPANKEQSHGQSLGDANGDGIINGSDAAIMATEWGEKGNNLAADFNHDGVVNGADLTILQNDMNQTVASFGSPTQPTQLTGQSLGDANGDGIINGSDAAIMATEWGEKGNNLAADFNHDGVVNGADLTILQNDMNQTVASFGSPTQPTQLTGQSLGDANGDGIINGSDAAIMATEWGEKGSNLAADFNHDGVVNDADLTILQNDMNQTVASFGVNTDDAANLAGSATSAAAKNTAVQEGAVNDGSSITSAAVEIPVTSAPATKQIASSVSTTLPVNTTLTPQVSSTLTLQDVNSLSAINLKMLASSYSRSAYNLLQAQLTSDLG